MDFNILYEGSFAAQVYAMDALAGSEIISSKDIPEWTSSKNFSASVYFFVFITGSSPISSTSPSLARYWQTAE